MKAMTAANHADRLVNKAAESVFNQTELITERREGHSRRRHFKGAHSFTVMVDFDAISLFLFLNMVFVQLSEGWLVSILRQ